MYPIAPFNLKALRDTLFRFPLSKMNERPKIMSGVDQTRQSEGQDQITEVVKKA